VWLAVTVILPIVVSGNEWNYERALFALNRFMLLFPVCILFDHRDRAEDTLQGIRNIVSLLDEKRMDILFYTCTAVAVLAAILLQLKMRSIMDTVYILIPSVLLALTYTRSKNSRSDLWYYTYLDGLMALSGFLYFFLPL
jgi:1,4-dihydroxy-2-naphthoate octaprenyltransferase